MQDQYDNKNHSVFYFLNSHLGEAMEESVSAFMIATCQVIPKIYYTDVNQAKDLYITNPTEEYDIVCGSAAEFFIQPRRPCVDDVDFLHFAPNGLAFTEEIPVLPHDVRHISDTVDCFMIEPYNDYPAFVRLRRLGQMRYNWECKIFEFEQIHHTEFIEAPYKSASDKPQHNELHIMAGPAMKFSATTTIPFTSDFVLSIWGSHWPKQAKNWPCRQRNYGWPTIATIQEVVQNGCHVVGAKHPACRDDAHQWRLSFSIAEVILLQSWTKVQQIVYHMLRFFAKRQLIKKDCRKEDEVLCSYHLKTLMLWSCEEMPPKWWDSTSVIAICCNLLQRLAKCLRRIKCPNYFIPEANLFHEHMNRKIINESAQILNKFCDSKTLSFWFVMHYMQPISRRVIDARWVNRYMMGICEDLKKLKPLAIDYYFSLKFQHDTRESNTGVKKGLFDYRVLYGFRYVLSTSYYRAPSREIEPFYELYESMLLTLRAARSLDCLEMQYDSQWFVDVIRKVSVKPRFLRSKNHSFPIPWKTLLERSHSYFLKAQDLMENLIGPNGHLEFKLVFQLSMELLRKASECVDSKSETIASATLTYMAALHFAASEYQTVIDLCQKVIINRTLEDDKKDIETLNAGCLYYIDDIVRIIGFYLLFRHVQNNLPCSRRRHLDLRLSPAVFAQHLLILSNERSSRAFSLYCVWQTPKFPLDEILTTASKRKPCGISKKAYGVVHAHQRNEPDNENSIINDKLNQTLMEYALENMTSFYNALCKVFDIHCNTGLCYRAAYLYNSRHYSEVLNLCEQILNQVDLQNDLKEFAFPNVMVLPPLDSYFDRDIQWLLGFHTLVCFLSPLNEDLLKIQDTTELTFQHLFAQNIYAEKLPLSALVGQPYIIKCHYFLRSQFLARYLRLRCLMDFTVRSRSEVKFEFIKLKSKLPFEHIIYCFLQQKLKQHQNVKHVTD